MKKKANTTIPQVSTSAAVLSGSTLPNIPTTVTTWVRGSRRPYTTRVPGTFIRRKFEDSWVTQYVKEHKKWLRESAKYGPLKKCRKCQKTLARNENYLSLDHHDYGHFTSIVICTDCVTDWSNELHKLNNDIQRSSTSEC